MKLLLLLLSILVALVLSAAAQLNDVDEADANTTGVPRGYPCPDSGYLRDPEDCAAFFRCDPSHGTYATALLRCPANLLFDKILNVCNWPNAVDCNDEASVTTVTP